MNPVIEELKLYHQHNSDDILHVGRSKTDGAPVGSGRYPLGSGKNPYQHSGDFLSYLENIKKEGWKETPENIQEMFGMTTGQFRNLKSYAQAERRKADYETAKKLSDAGLGPTEIGRRMGKSESSVRTLLSNTKAAENMNKAKNTADFLKKQVDEKRMIDVGNAVEIELGVSKEKMKQAIEILQMDGYHVYKGGIPQPTNKGKQTNQMVLCAPDVKHKEIYNYDAVKTISDYRSDDNGDTFRKFQYPASMDSSRLAIRYAEDGGLERDGLVEIRRGVKDLSLGNSSYAQIRILVDGTHFIKGMAIYSDNMPKGVDVVFNTNKSKKVPKMDVLKAIKTEDPNNPFGSLIKASGQSEYVGDDGKKHLSLINKRAEEGDWNEWSDTLPSQFLSKQSLELAKRQLTLSLEAKKTEYEQIQALTNPTVKKDLLKSFSEGCDAASVHLKAAALPKQKYHVMIPMNAVPDNQVYAPKYKNGTKVALIRYPHAGIFEIPILTVNNNSPQLKKMTKEFSDIKNFTDAVGVSKKVADQLSGADFDGDTVMVIPTGENGVHITNREPFKELIDFDPKDAYPETKGMKYMVKGAVQGEMGKISNLISDMNLQGAEEDEMVRAVKHSMVVIDAKKHNLNYKQSEKDNDIAGLKKKYQSGGASTLITRAKGQVSVLKRQGSPKINIKGAEWYDPSRPEGALIYKTTDDLYYPERKYDKKTGIMTIRKSDGTKVEYNVKDKKARDYYTPVEVKDPETGKVSFTNKDGSITYRTKERLQRSTRMAETDDARTLINPNIDTPMERLYADYANQLKSMANKARIDYVSTGKVAYSRQAAKTYEKEVSSLNKKLETALLNKPKERQAIRLTNAEVAARVAENEDMDEGDIKKIKQQAISKYRAMLGAKRTPVIIEDKEWEAIQAGAISENKLKQIIDNTDKDNLRELATPRNKPAITDAQIRRIKSMGANGNISIAEIAQTLGLSTSTVSKYLKG